MCFIFGCFVLYKGLKQDDETIIMVGLLVMLTIVSAIIVSCK